MTSDELVLQLRAFLRGQENNPDVLKIVSRKLLEFEAAAPAQPVPQEEPDNITRSFVKGEKTFDRAAAPAPVLKPTLKRLPPCDCGQPNDVIEVHRESCSK